MIFLFHAVHITWLSMMRRLGAKGAALQHDHSRESRMHRYGQLVLFELKFSVNVYAVQIYVHFFVDVNSPLADHEGQN